MAGTTSPPPAGRQVIQSYGDGGFRIAGAAYTGSVLVLPDRTLPWPIAVPDDITADSLTPILAAGRAVRVLLVGCGVRAAPLDAALRRHLVAAGIGVETMDTGAACRTFNVLVAEARAVAAALIAVD